MSTQVASLYATIGADTAPFEKGAKSVKTGLTGMKDTISKVVPPGVAQFATMGGAILGVGMAIKNTLDVTNAYANEVRQLAMLSGTSTENSSRFIQVLDDYKISAQDALAATRKLTSQGLAPSIETLADLSDKYLALNTVEEKNKFILDNLGRGGMQWVEVLGKGGAALRAQGEAVSDNLILSQRSVDAARRMELAQDDLSDAIMGVKLGIGNALVPAMTSLSKGLANGVTAWGNFGEQLGTIAELLGESSNGFLRAYSSYMKWALGVVGIDWDKPKDGINDLDYAARHAQDGIKLLALQAGMAEEEIRAMTEANEGYLSGVENMASIEESYSNDMEGHYKNRKDLQKELDDAIAAGYDKHGSKITEIKAEMATVDEAIKKTKEEHDLATKGIIWNLLQQQLAIGGLDEAETAYLLEKGVEWGMWGEDVVEEYDKAMAKANEFYDARKRAEKNKTIKVNYDISVTGSIPSGAIGNSYAVDWINRQTAALNEDEDEDIDGEKAAGGGLSSGWNLVGENGPELIEQSGYVHSNLELKRIAAGQNTSSIPKTVDLSDETIRKLSSSISVDIRRYLG